MSVSKRAWHVVRANLTDFKAAFGRDPLRDELDPEDGQDLNSPGARVGRKARQAADRAAEQWQEAFEQAQARAGVRAPELQRLLESRQVWLRTLELDHDASDEDIRKAYRRLLVKYHPDKFARDPQRAEAATELTRKITHAYRQLVREQ